MTCQHRGCNCEGDKVERGGKSYCSERCADVEASARHESKCPCGHAGCAGGGTRPSPK